MALLCINIILLLRVIGRQSICVNLAESDRSVIHRCIQTPLLIDILVNWVSLILLNVNLFKAAELLFLYVYHISHLS